MATNSKLEEDAVVELRDPISGSDETTKVQMENEDSRDPALKESLHLDKLSETQIFEKGVIGLNKDSASPQSVEAPEPTPAPEISKEVENPMQRKYIHEDSSHPNWTTHKKHIFILSSAGKPIYSRYGDEQNLSPFMASLTAMVSFVADMKDNLRYIVAGKHKFVFLVKGNLVLVSVSKTGEPVPQLLSQLNYVHSQILSMLTSGVNNIFEKRPYFDLRNLLGGADKFWDNMISLMDHDFSFLLNSIHCLRLDNSTRTSIGNVIQSAQAQDLLYAIVMANHQLVNLVRPKKYILQAQDLHLIMNFINSSSSFKSSVSWTPLCLPQFNDQGFLHAYVCYIAPSVCLLLISTKADSFYELANCKNLIVQGLTKTGALDQVNTAINQNYNYSVSEVGIPRLRHFLYKSKAQSQFTCPKIEAPYADRHETKRLFRLYQYVYHRIHRFKKTHKVYYQVSQYETVVAWVTNGFELYAIFGPLESKASCIKSCNDILQWIKNEENSLFILNFPNW